MSAWSKMTVEDVNLEALAQVIREVGRPVPVNVLARAALRAQLDTEAGERHYAPGSQYQAEETVLFNGQHATVRSVQVASNPAQGHFCVLTLVLPNGTERLVAAGVSGAPTEDRQPVTDAQAEEVLRTHRAEAHRTVQAALAADPRFVTCQTLQGDLWCLTEMIPLVSQTDLRKALALLPQELVGEELVSCATEELVKAAWSLEDDGGDPYALYAFALRQTLDGLRDVVNLGDRWTSARACEAFIARPPLEVPRMPTQVTLPESIEAATKAQIEHEQRLEAAGEGEEPGGEEPVEEDLETWRQDRLSHAVFTLRARHYYEDWLPLSKQVGRLFPPLACGRQEVVFHHHFGDDPEPCRALVDREQGRVWMPREMYETFRRHRIYPGARLRISARSEREYDIATRETDKTGPIHVWRMWLDEDGQIQYDDHEEPRRYDVDDDVYVADVRFEDREALLRQAEEVGNSIFGLMYQRAVEWWEAQGRKDLVVTADRLFDAVHFDEQGRMTSKATIAWELWRRLAFKSVGEGRYLFRPRFGDLARTAFKPRARPLRRPSEKPPADVTPPPEPTTEITGFFIFQQRPDSDYADRVGVIYNWHQGIPGSKQITEGARFVYYHPGEQVFFGTGCVASIEAYAADDGQTYYDGHIADYELWDPPLPLTQELALQLSFVEPERLGIGQAGIRKVSQDDFKTLLDAYRQMVEEDQEPVPPKETITEFWTQVAALEGRELHTLDEQRPFRVLKVGDHTVQILVESSGKTRPIQRQEIETAWGHLAREGSITRKEIHQQYSEFNPPYISAILAALPGVTHRTGPIRLLYGQEAEPDAALEFPSTEETSEVPPVERRRDRQILMPGMPMGPLFDTQPSTQTPMPKEPPREPGPEPQVPVPSSPTEPPLAGPPSVPTPRTRSRRDQMQAKPLFSRHYLETRLPDHREWTDDPRAAFEAVRTLWRTARQYGDKWNEAQTEEGFVKPVLEALGWTYTVQPKASSGGKITWPDYALFENSQVKAEADHYLGQDDPFYSRALAIAEAKYWGRPLSQKDASGRNTWKVGSNPSHQMVSYLVGTRVPWGILTNGRTWRLYSREVSSTASEFYEVDLDLIFDFLPDDVEPSPKHLDDFRRWWFFFRRDAFTPDPQGKSFVQRVHEGSSTYAREISDKLKELIFEQVVPEIAGGFVAYRYHQRGIREETDESLGEIYAATLSLLYKLLFLLYAEARSLLPISNPSYREQSLTVLARWAAERLDKKLVLSDVVHATPRYDALLALFHRIDQGDSSLGIPRYNGGLFNPTSPENRFLEEHKLSDRTVAHAVDILVRDAGQPVDYAYISVRNLGAIYEGLLENKLRVLDASVGRAELVNDKAERKASGSYYTPDYIVKYIVRHTLGPILEEHGESFGGLMEKISDVRHRLADGRRTASIPVLRDQLDRLEHQARETLLDIKVCDPAMGSGHFLVEAADFLTDGLIEILNLYPDHNPILAMLDRIRGQIVDSLQRQGIPVDPARLDDTQLLQRVVMKRCIYGVDLNPMAVELAKVSLWLHTFTMGAPLSFLDHHLRCGNSLIGATVREAEAEMAKLDDSAQLTYLTGPFVGVLRAAEFMQGISLIYDATFSDVEESAKLFRQFDQAAKPYKQLLDIFVARHFGVERADEFLRLYGADAIKAGPDSVGEPYAEAMRQAWRLYQERRFFHWDLEFPEVFIDLERATWKENPGFDAVVGNPPYGRYATLDNLSRTYIRAASLAFGSGDLAEAFTSQGLKIVQAPGWLGFVLPKVLTYVMNWSTIRAELLENSTIHRIFDIGKAFEDVLYEQIVLCTRVGMATEQPFVVDIASQEKVWQAFEAPRGQLSQRMFRIAADRDEQRTIRKVGQLSERSGTIYDVWYGKGGVVPHLHKGDGTLRVLQGRDINRYRLIADTLPDVFLALSYAKQEEIRAHARRKVVVQDIVAHIENPFPHIKLTAYLDEHGLFCLNTLTCFARLEENEYQLEYLLALLNSTLMSWYSYLALFNRAIRTIHFMPGYADNVPIRRVAFTTPPDERARQVGVGISDETASVSFSTFSDSVFSQWLDERLSPIHTPDPELVRQHNADPLNEDWQLPEDGPVEQSDVVHDLLAHLADQMIAMHKEKQGHQRAFRLDLAGYLDEQQLRKINRLYTPKKPPKEGIKNYDKRLTAYEQAVALAQAQLGPLASETLALDDFWRLNQAQWMWLLRQRLGKVADMSDLVAVYGQYRAQLAPLMRRIQRTDWLIDQVVYQLYGLTEEEIAVVEGR